MRACEARQGRGGSWIESVCEGSGRDLHLHRLLAMERGGEREHPGRRRAALLQLLRRRVPKGQPQPGTHRLALPHARQLGIGVAVGAAAGLVRRVVEQGAHELPCVLLMQRRLRARRRLRGGGLEGVRRLSAGGRLAAGRGALLVDAHAQHGGGALSRRLGVAAGPRVGVGRCDRHHPHRPAAEDQRAAGSPAGTVRVREHELGRRRRAAGALRTPFHVRHVAPLRVGTVCHRGRLRRGLGCAKSWRPRVLRLRR